MSTVTAQTLLAFIAAHNCVSPSLAPVMVGIAQHESGLDATKVHRNPNGTYDVGIAQINTSNFGWLGLTWETALDPCRNIAAGAAVLLAHYNGSPPDPVKATYAARTIADIRAVEGAGQNPPASALAAPREEAEINDRPASTDDRNPSQGDDNDGN
jgi:hypothetical protein